jgi:hypothetical protein
MTNVIVLTEKELNRAYSQVNKLDKAGEVNRDYPVLYKTGIGKDIEFIFDTTMGTHGKWVIDTKIEVLEEEWSDGNGY